MSWLLLYMIGCSVRMVIYAATWLMPPHSSIIIFFLAIFPFLKYFSFSEKYFSFSPEIFLFFSSNVCDSILQLLLFLLRHCSWICSTCLICLMWPWCVRMVKIRTISDVGGVWWWNLWWWWWWVEDSWLALPRPKHQMEIDSFSLSTVLNCIALHCFASHCINCTILVHCTVMFYFPVGRRP